MLDKKDNFLDKESRLEWLKKMSVDKISFFSSIKFFFSFIYYGFMRKFYKCILLTIFHVRIVLKKILLKKERKNKKEKRSEKWKEVNYVVYRDYQIINYCELEHLY